MLAGIQAGLDYLDSFHKTLPESMFLDDYLNAGSAYIDLKDYDVAEDMFSMALGINKGNTDALIGLGMVKFFKGQYPFATSKFDDVLRKNPRNTLAYTYKAVSQANAGNLGESVNSIEKATSYGSKEAIAWYYAVAIYAESGDMAKATHAIGQAKSISPNNEYIQELEAEIAGSSSSVFSNTVSPTSPIPISPKEEITIPTVVPTQEKKPVSQVTVSIPSSDDNAIFVDLEDVN